MSNANEPAYPFPVLHGKGAPSGLTKREAFAMAAMQGLSANSMESWRARNMTPSEEIEDEARIAVRMADALLAELAKTHP